MPRRPAPRERLARPLVLTITPSSLPSACSAPDSTPEAQARALAYPSASRPASQIKDAIERSGPWSVPPARRCPLDRSECARVDLAHGPGCGGGGRPRRRKRGPGRRGGSGMLGHHPPTHIGSEKVRRNAEMYCTRCPSQARHLGHRSPRTRSIATRPPRLPTSRANASPTVLDETSDHAIE
jgi:hypothetical protein